MYILGVKSDIATESRFGETAVSKDHGKSILFFFFFLSQSSIVVELESYRFVLSPMRSPKLWKHQNNFLITRSDAMKSARKRKGRQVSHIAPINRTMCNNLVVDNLKNFLDHAIVNRPI